MKKPFLAYENEMDSFHIEELKVENQLNKISIEGKLELTKDQRGRDDILIVW